jgi:DNA-3-methyladenine glycosylase II
MKEEYFPFGEKEISWLKSRDPALGAVISRMEKPERKLLPDLFSGLVFYIISQQISAKAAEREWMRFQKLFSPVVPENICRYTPEEIQKCGTTMKRAGYIRHIAEKLADGSLHVDSLCQTDNVSFIREITKLPGIGEWTAQMLLIHVLKRPDVISYKDLAVLRGMRMVYHMPRISRPFFEQKRELYSPYATTAGIYFRAISGRKLLQTADKEKQRRKTRCFAEKGSWLWIKNRSIRSWRNMRMKNTGNSHPDCFQV